jgi:hypothetical protein
MGFNSGFKGLMFHMVESSKLGVFLSIPTI